MLERRREPDTIKTLSDFVVEWTSSVGGQLARIKNAPFDEMLIKTVPVGLGLDQITEFSCPMKIASEEEMDEKKREAYRRLKRMECELKYEGLISKRPYFKSSESLWKLKKYIPNLNMSNDLINALHNDRLMNLVKKIKPEEFKISLISVSEEDFTKILSSSEGMISSMARFYDAPERIVWLFKLRKMLLKGPNYNRDVMGAFNILRSASDITFAFTSKYMN